MRALCILLAGLALPVFGAEAAKYDLKGHIVPKTKAAVNLFAVQSPFTASTLADSGGQFHFHDLLPGLYTVSIFIPLRGEQRQTVEVGPSLADKKGQVEIKIRIDDSKMETGAAGHGGAVVSAQELSIPDRARHEYDEAQKKLSHHDTLGAIKHLQRALEIAPQYSAAWNNLGTIAYQTRQFEKAEIYFRKALKQDPASFEPLVNLGGVLLTLGKLDSALQYNIYAVLSRPNDALANSQLGMTYFAVGNFDLAQEYLKLAKRLDPAHFSDPQLTLAEIYLRRNEPKQAADELENFLKYHPDSPRAPKIRAAIVKLRQQTQ